MNTPNADKNTTGWFSRLRESLQRARSPLTVKIVAFNLVALSALVGGILLMNQSGNNLIDIRQNAISADATVLANALALQMDVSGETELTPSMAKRLVELAEPINAEVQLYDTNGTPLLRFNEDSTSTKTPQSLPERTNSVDDIFDDVWRRLSGVFNRTAVEHDKAYLDPYFDDMVQQTLSIANTYAFSLQNSIQQHVIAVAAPIVYNGTVVGVVLLSTPAGEIDGYVKTEQRQILYMFLLAIFTSTVLSIMLARTIAYPLRQLTDAAARGSVRGANAVNLGRINIPDLTARPDEIGDLSRQMGNMTSALYDRIDANADFAADVAHEIKNPLTSLGSAVETMRYAKAEDAREKLLNVIQDDVRRMDRLVTDISNASRLDAELANDEIEQFSLTNLLQNLVDYQKDLAAEDGVTLLADFPDTPITIPGLESRLAQVFVNLITNAISFVPEGGHVKVIIRETDGETVQTLIEDTGCGIPKENLTDVFKRFYSSRPAQEFGNNSGLGLAISKQIVEAHGGKIWAENIYADDLETPVGARFTVELPV